MAGEFSRRQWDLGSINAHTIRLHVAGERGPPITSTFLGDFARYLKDVRLVPTIGTINAYLGEVANFCFRQLHIRPSIPDILTKALDREAADKPATKAKDPATPEFVAAFIQDSTIPLVFRAAATVMWHGTFRSSDLLSTRVSTPGNRDPRRSDISFAEDLSYARLVLRKGKPFEKNQTNIRLITRPKAEDTWAIDPVTVILDYLHATSHFGPDDPLFRHADGSLATKKQMATAIKRKAVSLGLNPDLYACHSFRSGGNTAMRALEVPDADVLSQGGWLSSTGDAPYRRRNVSQAQRAQNALRLPISGHTLPATNRVTMVSTSSPLLDVTSALARRA
jgi:hypothetical protein